MSICIKICGLSNAEDALCAAEAGADCLGFVLHPPSPRYVPPESLRKLIRGLPPEIPKIGVFVNRTPEEISALLEFCGLAMAQLHGDETPADAKTVGVERVLKAVHLQSRHDVEEAVSFPAEALVVDTALPGKPGGTGVVGDWDLALRLAGQRRIFLAGGLNPHNVGKAVNTVSPFGVDVSTGVEAAPAYKDHKAIHDFINVVRTCKNVSQPEN